MGFTKKCPYCAENIQSKAIVCKHCSKSLPQKKSFVENLSDQRQDRLENMTEKEREASLAKQQIMVFWFFILLAALLIASEIGYWAILILVVGIWLHPKKDKSPLKSRLKNFKKEKVRSLLSAVLLVAMLIGLGDQLVSYAQVQIKRMQRAEEQRILTEQQIEIVILSSQEHQGDNLTYLLEFEAEKAETVEVNNDIAKVSDGRYSLEIALEDVKTGIKIKVKNQYDSESKYLTIERNETPEEGLIRLEQEEARAAEKAELEAERAEAEAKYEAALAAEKAEWEATAAGQICKRHPSWEKYDCTKIANNQYWIGMSYEMLVEQRGRPSSANPSDYGYGVQWQWCWYNWTPMCFYDDDDDGLVDSLN